MEVIKVDRLLKSDGTASDIAVNATADVWTKSHKIAYASSISISMRAKSSTGTPDLDIYLEQTHIDPSSVSTGEGVIGDVNNGWKIPEGSTRLIDITDENWHHFSISPVALPYMRLLLDGQGTSPADTTVEIWISKQELFD